MMVTLVLVILLVLQAVLSAPNNPQETTEQHHVVLCVKAIMAQYFTPGRPTAVVIPDSSRDANIRQRLLSAGLIPQGSLGRENYMNMRNTFLGRSHDKNALKNAFSNLHDVNIHQSILGNGQDINIRQSKLFFDHHINNLPHTSSLDHHLHQHHSDYHLTDFMMEALSQETRWPFIVIRPRNNETKHVFLQQQEQYLLILWPLNYEVLSVLRRIFLSSTPSHTKGLLIVILTGDLLQNKVLPLETLRSLTDHPSHNAIIIVPNSQYKYTDLDHQNHILKVLDLYSWFPTGTGKYCNESRQLVHINQWLIKGDGRFVTKRNLFPSRTPTTDIQGCTITVFYVPFLSTSQFFFFRHLENRIVKTIADSLHARVTSAQLSREADILVGGIQAYALPAGKGNLFHISHPHVFTTLKWYAACGKPNPRQGNFIKVFTWSLWLVLSITCLLTALVMFWIYKRSYKPTTVSECFLTVWSVTLGLSVPQLPRTCRPRVFLLMLVFYSLAISTVFQALFTAFLVEPGFQKQALQDMVYSGTKCLFALFDAASWCHNETICFRCSPCNDTLTCFGNFLESSNYAVLANELNMEVMLPYLSKNYLVCSTTDKPVHVIYAMLVSKRSSAISIINNKILRMIEVGIINKLKTESVIHIRHIIRTQRHNFLAELKSPNLEAWLDEKAPSSYKSESEYFIFTLSHLKVAFCLLLIGHGISSAVLLAEILTHRRHSCSTHVNRREHSSMPNKQILNYN
jgi:hypothetical protein